MVNSFPYTAPVTSIRLQDMHTVASHPTEPSGNLLEQTNKHVQPTHLCSDDLLVRLCRTDHSISRYTAH